MFDTTDTTPSDRGLSARHLVFVFLASVAVCAVFFSLGYLVGYNEKESKAAMTTENVSAPAAIPPVVNVPSSSQPAATSAAATPVTPPAESNAAPVLQTIERPAPLPPKRRMPRAAETKTREGMKKPSRMPSAASSGSQERASAALGSGYSVQVMASRTQADANSLARLLKGRGFPAFVLSAQAINASDNLFRVLVGPYSTRAQAQAALENLRREGFQPFIKH